MYTMNVGFRLKSVWHALTGAVIVFLSLLILTPPSHSNDRTLSVLASQCMMERGDGCEDLGDYYMLEKPQVDWLDQALHAYKRGCQNASNWKLKGASCEKVAATLGEKSSGAIINSRKIYKFHTKACKFENQTGCANQGKDLFCGVGVQMDKSRGTSLIEKACYRGIKEACDWLKKDGAICD